MNETLYIYYIIPDYNFVSEKETNENTDNQSGPIEKLLSGLAIYFPFILLFILIYILFRKN